MYWDSVASLLASAEADRIRNQYSEASSKLATVQHQISELESKQKGDFGTSKRILYYLVLSMVLARGTWYVLVFQIVGWEERAVSRMLKSRFYVNWVILLGLKLHEVWESGACESSLNWAGILLLLFLELIIMSWLIHFAGPEGEFYSFSDKCFELKVQKYVIKRVESTCFVKPVPFLISSVRIAAVSYAPKTSLWFFQLSSNEV